LFESYFVRFWISAGCIELIQNTGHNDLHVGTRHILSINLKIFGRVLPPGRNNGEARKKQESSYVYYDGNNLRMTEKNDRLIPTRWSLISRLKDWHDRDSWKTFFDTYWKLIYGVAIKAGLSDSEAEEVVQETVITVSKKINEFKADPALGSFKGWLMTITRWRIQDQLRKRQMPGVPGTRVRQETQRTSTVHSLPDPQGCRLEAIWDEEWQNNLVDVALDRIKQRVSAKQYQVFYLNVIKQLPVRQVARALGVNAAQVYLAKHRVGSLVKKEIRALESKIV
jgi:RNA polymerase sigma factor (sigma-70 family)